jgi:hypothetical protein
LNGLAFVDTNVIAYALGTPHRYREPCREVLVLAARQRHMFCSSAEVMQELLHIGVRRGDLAYAERGVETISSACGMLESVSSDDIVSAIRLVSPGLEGRDLVHLAVMQRIGCNQIISTDRAFDAAPGITRLDPLDFESWRDRFIDTPPANSLPR